MNEKLKSTILGFFIGLAVIIPGFSGAQLAVIFKLYDKLMAALDKLFSKKSIIFLLPIIGGAILGFVLGLFSIKYLLTISIFAVTATFAGMMIGSIGNVIDEVKTGEFKRHYILYLAIGILIPLIISTTAIFTNLDYSELFINIPPYFYLIAIIIGFLIALTQLVPGLSATALLLSLGMYNALLETVSLDFWKANPKIILVYFMVAVGGLIGVILLSKLINNALIKHKTPFYYLIIGLCISNIINMFYNNEIITFFKETSNIALHLSIGIILCIIMSAMMVYIYFKSKKNTLENK